MASSRFPSIEEAARQALTAEEIQAAIDGNRGNMGFLSSLTPEEVQAIADALAN